MIPTASFAGEMIPAYGLLREFPTHFSGLPRLKQVFVYWHS
jgi:hypothetical protein